MSVQSASAFVNRMKMDLEFATRVSEAKTQQDRWAILRESGFSFTETEFQQVHDENNDEVLLVSQSSVLRAHECACCKC